MAAVIEEKTIRGLREIAVLVLTACATFFLISLVTFDLEDAGWTHSGSGLAIKNACGMAGAWLADFLLSFIGLTAYLVPALILWYVYLIYSQHKSFGSVWCMASLWSGFLLAVLSCTTLLYLHLPRLAIPLPGNTGGILGQEVGDRLLIAAGNSGANLVALVMLLAAVTLLTGFSWLRIVELTGKYTLLALRGVLLAGAWFGKLFIPRRAEVAEPAIAKPRFQPELPEPKPKPKSKPRPVADVPEPAVAAALSAPIEAVFESLPLFGKIKEPKTAKKSNPPPLKAYQTGTLPALSLLDQREAKVKGYSADDLEDMSRRVEDILLDFGVTAEVVDVHPGPVITRFELQPAAGVKASRISNLSKDIARMLSVTSVRVVEVIPGKSVIGLEIPNKEREMVNLRDLLSTQQYDHSVSPLTLALGKNISGEPVVADLAKMPHVLVAGTTGSGKSVAINTMILSLLYKSTPEQVRMIMVDPKMLELSVYEGIPHLLTPVVTDMKEAANALRWSVGEMERRYKLMSKVGVRNLKGFNHMVEEAEKNGEAIRDPMFVLDRPLEEGEEFPLLKTLPHIVIVIDELADMMMIVGKKVEELIARLAQKARAAGIHLILATQRPSVDVLTGLIKANIPTRISFQVSSRIDSRTVLDQGGAETLLGNGDMLFLPSGTSIPIRAHGAFVDDHEVHQVVEFLKQTAPTDYLDITKDADDDGSFGGGSGSSGGGSESDALYDEAVAFVTDSRKASISSVQRRFKIGYNRAARIIEDMEAAGIVSPPETNGSREVLAPAPVKD
ncbi:MAG: DNA translocase FtsK [Gammaproteobacteria bacterium]